MEPSFSASRVTVEYFDPHDVYRLVTPGLVPRLPLRNLHWQSHSGPSRSIDTLHVELVPASPADGASRPSLGRSGSVSVRDDGFQTQAVGSANASTTDVVDAQRPGSAPRAASRSRRHQIPGLRQTPYLKVLFVRCDDSDAYKGHVRSEIRDWVKAQAFSSTSSKKSGMGLLEAHDAFEWLVVHVVLPNTTAATQPRVSKTTDTIPDNRRSSTKWKGGSSTLLEKLRADFNGTGKHSGDRVAQVRIGINDVPYEMLPRVVPAVPSGYTDTEEDVQGAWMDLFDKLKSLILASFDMRVTRYEDDIREKDAQRSLPGWNFCTFFILKEGLARGFESVGLVEDALVGYDELSVGLDSVMAEQAVSGAPESHGGALLPFSHDLMRAARKALGSLPESSTDQVGDEAVDLQSSGQKKAEELDMDDIPILSSKKPYREMILANNVSLFDFRCYLFSRQVSLLLRLGNAWSSQDELLAKLKEQQDSVLHGVARQTRPPKPSDQVENLSMLAEICRRTLEFVPFVSHVMRHDLLTGLASVVSEDAAPGQRKDSAIDTEKVVSNVVATFAFSVVQQILAQTSSHSLPIPPSTLLLPDGPEPKSSIPEPKTIMHPARSSSLHMAPGSRPPPSPNIFGTQGTQGTQGGGRLDHHGNNSSGFLKSGLLELAARRAELYSLSRNILEKVAKEKGGWTDGWSQVPVMCDNADEADMDEIDLKEEDGLDNGSSRYQDDLVAASVATNQLLSVAVSSEGDFQRLYETLTDKALRHYTVAEHEHSVNSCYADLAVLKYRLGKLDMAADYFEKATPFFGSAGWSLLELSLLTMYCRCLKELKRSEKFVTVAVTLLHMAARTSREQVEQSSLRGEARRSTAGRIDLSATRGVVQDVLTAIKGHAREATVSLGHFFHDVSLGGGPEYHSHDDGFSVQVGMHSLLVDALPVDKAELAMTCVDGNSTQRIQLYCRGPQTIKPGKSALTFHCNHVATGRFAVDSLILSAEKLVLSFERDVHQPLSNKETIFRSPALTIYERPQTLQVAISAARDTRLDRDNSLDLQIRTGWNSVQSCEVAVKAATGGLRLLISDACILNSDVQLARPSESARFFLGSMEPESSVTVRFPFSVEGEVPSVKVRLDLTFRTEHGDDFHLSKTDTVPVSLALAVNVQDVFKHDALYSRFTVSTSSSSPLRLYKSELVKSDIFESQFGVPPRSTVLVFPRQPATLLYKINRTDAKLSSKTKKTMYLKLYFSVLSEELENLVNKTMTDALASSPPLRECTRLLVPIVTRAAQAFLTSAELERTALTATLDTGFVADIDWVAELPGLDAGGKGRGVSDISAFFNTWQAQHKRLPVEVAPQSLQNAKSILIPVDIPSIPALVTADIKLQPSTPGFTKVDMAGITTVCVNDMIPSTLHLKWTRRWATESPTLSKGRSSQPSMNISFDVASTADAWLVGGRRKGHFLVPETDVGDMDEGSMTVPLLLVPLREGWLPYPSVDVKEVHPADEDGEVIHHGAHCETDVKNLGEVVRVVADRERVTVSLDSSGPGGGPLVLESERMLKHGRVLA